MAKDLTQGRIMPMLIKFTIPLILGNIFQLTYNAVDSIIVGRFVGKEALAAVGICNPITTLIILFLNGLCMGASILMGNYFGGKKMDTLSRQISTTMISGMIFSLALTLIAIVFTRPILMLVQVDRSIMTLTTQYLRIIMLGLIFTFLYNFFSSTLRALGDSATPLYFLIISAVLNVFGDLFFVVVLKAGSNGCAVATVVSEALCCVFCMIYIKFKVPILCLGKKWLVFDRSLLKKTISYGWASAMQQATVQLGKIGIQAIINTMGVSVSAAFAVVNRIDDYAYTPEQNIAHGMTAMMAQNKGAGRNDRVIKGFMIQGGDPNGIGTGGPGYRIKGEFIRNGFPQNTLKHEAGVISMARSMMNDSAGSQFFIMHETSPHLDGEYAAFGKVIEGMDVVNAIANCKTGRADRPVEDQRMKHVTVETFGVEYPEVVKC